MRSLIHDRRFVAKVHAMRAEGVSVKEIAKALRCSTSPVYKAVLRRTLPAPRRSPLARPTATSRPSAAPSPYSAAFKRYLAASNNRVPTF